jgi:hypothetical protein
MEGNLEFIERYYEYQKLDKPMEKISPISFREEANSIDYSYIEQILIDIDSVDKRPTWTEDQAKDYFSNAELFHSRLDAKYQVSDSTGQNILYSIADEFHGYNGDNNTLNIINFYNA